MSSPTAVASSPPATPAQESAAARAAELKVIGLLLGGVFLVGAVLQRFVAPGPVSTVVYTVGLTAALVAAAYVARGRLLDALGGFRLAALTLSILGVASALGTMVLQDKPADFYKLEYGASAALILGLRMDDLFHSLWFGGFVAVMNAGLIVSALRRWPPTLRNAGFFAVHVGILVALAGAGVSSVFSVKGRIDLRVGESASTVRVTKAGLPVGEEVPLGASVQLLDFDVDHWASEPRLGLYLPSKKGKGYDLKTTFENEPGVKLPLPEGAYVRILGYYPDLVLEERVVDSGGDTPVLKLVADGRESFLTPARPRLDLAGGTVAVLFGWQRPEARIDAPRHTVQGEAGEAKAVRLGETVTLEGGTQLKALRYFPHFTFDIGSKQARNVSDTPINPALEVEVAGARRWLFANMPGFGHGGEGGPKLTYAFSPEGGEAAATVIAVGGADRSVRVRRPDGSEETLALNEGLEIAGVKLGALLEKARLAHEPRTASAEAKNPAVRVEVAEKGQAPREVLMRAAQPEPLEVGRAFLTFETRAKEVKSFRSKVALRSGAEQSETIIAVNDPASVGPWELYQVNYDPKDPTYSGFEAVRDPGVNWVFLGFAMLFLGVTWTIYVGPRFKRKDA